MEKEKRYASQVLGILSICLFFLTWPGMVLSIIGLCLKKDSEHETRDWTLNIVGLVLSLLWTIYIVSLLGTEVY